MYYQKKYHYTIDINKIISNNYLNNDVNPKDAAAQETNPKQHQPQSTLRSVEDPTEFEETNLNIDWDSEQNWQHLFWLKIAAEKRARRREYDVIRRERYILEVKRRQMELK